MKYVLAIDQGTTSSRAILFNRTMEPSFISQQEFPQYFPKPGWVEHDPEEIWETTKSVLSDLYNSEIAKKNNIRGIGITNQRETTIVWDKKTGKPLYNAIVWQDRRTVKFCKNLVQKGFAKKIQKTTGLVVDSYFSASKINWLLKNVKAAKELLKKEFDQIKSMQGEKDETESNERMCPTHKVKLQKRRGYRGPFYGCPKYFSSEKCKYTEDA